jgi:hypothetical protein
MAERTPKRPPKPRDTVTHLFFEYGRACGYLELLADQLKDEPPSMGGVLLSRVNALIEGLRQASRWPQQRAIEQSWPLITQDLRSITEMLVGYGNDKPVSAAVRQLESQLRQLLPPDVRF